MEAVEIGIMLEEYKKKEPYMSIKEKVDAILQFDMKLCNYTREGAIKMRYENMAYPYNLAFKTKQWLR